MFFILWRGHHWLVYHSSCWIKQCGLGDNRCEFVCFFWIWYKHAELVLLLKESVDGEETYPINPHPNIFALLISYITDTWLLMSSINVRSFTGTLNLPVHFMNSMIDSHLWGFLTAYIVFKDSSRQSRGTDRNINSVCVSLSTMQRETSKLCSSLALDIINGSCRLLNLNTPFILLFSVVPWFSRRYLYSPHSVLSNKRYERRSDDFNYCFLCLWSMKNEDWASTWAGLAVCYASQHMKLQH